MDKIQNYFPNPDKLNLTKKEEEDINKWLNSPAGHKAIEDALKTQEKILRELNEKRKVTNEQLNTPMTI